MTLSDIVPCSVDPGISKKADAILAHIRKSVINSFFPGISDEQLSKQAEYRLAIERERGRAIANNKDQMDHIASQLDWMLKQGWLSSWEDTSGSGRCDFKAVMSNGTTVGIEAKGNLDGNSAQVSDRPDGVDEFYSWTTSSHAGTDLQKGLWSGLHTRLGVPLVLGGPPIDGVIMHDKICGTEQRPCPKAGGIIGEDGKRIPPPCLSMMAKTVEMNRLNRGQQLHQASFAQALHECFSGVDADVNFVDYDVRLDETGLSRQTTIRRGNHLIRQSKFTKVKRVLPKK
jgi:hypothetical protein